MCFWWSCHPQWLSVRSCLVQREDPWTAPILWAPPATSQPVCLPVMKAMYKLIPHLILCSVKHREVGMPHSHLVLVSPHILCVYLAVSIILQLFSILVCYHKGKATVYDFSRRLLLTSTAAPLFCSCPVPHSPEARECLGRLWRCRYEVHLWKHLQLQLCSRLPPGGTEQDDMHISSWVEWENASLWRWGCTLNVIQHLLYD